MVKKPYFAGCAKSCTSFIARHRSWALAIGAFAIVFVGYHWVRRWNVYIAPPMLHPIESMKTSHEKGGGEYDGDIVFLHGLRGDWKTTWQYDRETFWPEWLRDDFPSIRVWSASYDASLFGPALAFRERSKTLLDMLDNAEVGRDRPVVFVCHSLGGIMAMQSLNTAMTIGDEWKPIGSNVKGMIFFGTPHSGSGIPEKFHNAIVALGRFGVRFNSNVGGLEYGQKDLLDLGEWYRNQVRLLGVSNLVFYETIPSPSPFGIIVDKVCANPGVSDVIMRPVQATHIGMCKLQDRNGEYATVRKFIHENVVQRQKYYGALADFIPLLIKAQDDNTWLTKLRKHVGKDVEWTGVVIEVRDDDEKPAYTIGLTVDALVTEQVLARFPPKSSFDPTKQKGDTVTVVGRLKWIGGKGNGVFLTGCKLLPVRRYPGDSLTKTTSSGVQSD